MVVPSRPFHWPGGIPPEVKPDATGTSHPRSSTKRLNAGYCLSLKLESPGRMPTSQTMTETTKSGNDEP
ncbi:uncharacterized protein ACHE_60935S [Aspergillus chevalieri]|uniref:Uncharacterized protein n=1 Tax=Aspergillus chevalieri TaxID=182096 RepID=A0A7R7VUJ2_ASPCH|nr:uncharacterized protein ACHE_60935S [Aspergillus chevalieri]BCR91049.1 hypothetical protein ACHE_60935S [Aspergillus chevalieri]